MKERSSAVRLGQEDRRACLHLLLFHCLSVFCQPIKLLTKVSKKKLLFSLQINESVHHQHESIHTFPSHPFVNEWRPLGYPTKPVQANALPITDKSPLPLNTHWLGSSIHPQ